MTTTATPRLTWAKLLTRAGVIEGVTLNDRYTDRATDVPATLTARRPAWVGIQEGKNTDYADLLESERYAVEQRLRSEATAGVAIVYDRTQLEAIGNALDNPHRLGRGYQQLTGPQHGILARGVIWQDVCVKKGGIARRQRQVRIASTHRHPERAAEAWPEYDRELDQWIAASPIPVWLTLDGNTRRPGTIHVRGRRRFIGIDGHIITGALRFVAQRLRRLKRRTSDHRGVAALVRIPRIRPAKKETR